MNEVDPITDLFGPVIHSYTRAQAIADGVLVDVSATAREAGITVPVAVTQALWAKWIVPLEHDREQGQSEAGRLWDLVWLLRCAVARVDPGDRASCLSYRVAFQRRGARRTATVKAVCGPGDQAEPVITLMLPDED